MYTCLIYISDSSQNTSFSIVNFHLRTHRNEIWDLKAKLGLIWDILRNLVPIGTKGPSPKFGTSSKALGIFGSILNIKPMGDGEHCTASECILRQNLRVATIISFFRDFRLFSLQFGFCVDNTLLIVIRGLVNVDTWR